ncbi:hypothetical protein BC332_23962 [Capsicum chinense]|nr:hypothetical protein BC332_23962 [Capsicum chinense]
MVVTRTDLNWSTAQALAIELVELVCSKCNILKCVPNSALWLLRFPVAADKRLCIYVAVQGLQPNQIIFTDVAMRLEHIRRSSLADLFLNIELSGMSSLASHKRVPIDP